MDPSGRRSAVFSGRWRALTLPSSRTVALLQTQENYSAVHRRRHGAESPGSSSRLILLISFKNLCSGPDSFSAFKRRASSQTETPKEWNA